MMTSRLYIEPVSSKAKSDFVSRGKVKIFLAKITQQNSNYAD